MAPSDSNMPNQLQHASKTNEEKENKDDVDHVLHWSPSDLPARTQTGMKDSRFSLGTSSFSQAALDGRQRASKVQRMLGKNAGRESLAASQLNRYASVEDMFADGAHLSKEMQYKRLRDLITSQGKSRDRKSLGDEKTIMDTTVFVAFFGIVAFANMIVVGLDASYACPVSADPWCSMQDRGSWYYVENVFTVLFCVEMAVRIASMGPRTYFRGDILLNPWGLAVLRVIDFTIVFARAVDSWVLEPVGVATPIKIISCFRVLHISEIIRRNDKMKQFREVLVIMQSFWDASRVVFWTLVLMSVLLYVIGIVLTDQIMKADDTDSYNYSNSAWTAKPWTVRDYWGTVPKSIFSLFQVVTLDHWCSTLVRPLVTRHPAFIILFIPFLVIVVLSMLNVIVSVIVESVLASAAANEEKRSKETQKMHLKIMDSLRQIFVEADLDQSGDLDREELDRSLKEAHVHERLQVLQIENKDLVMLFQLLDEDGSGAVQCDKFFRGATRLQGVAQSCDMHHMSIDFNRYIVWCGELIAQHRQLNNNLMMLVHDLNSMDREVVKGEADEKDPVLMARRVRFTDPLHLDELATGDTIRKKKSSFSRKTTEDNGAEFSDDSGDFERRVSKQSLAQGVGTQAYDNSIMIGNEVRGERGLPMRPTHKEEYQHALQDHAARISMSEALVEIPSATKASGVSARMQSIPPR